MAFDPHKNFAIGSVAVAPSPALSGTSLGLQTGQGGLFPDPAVSGAYNVIGYPSGEVPTSANAEVLRVTALSGDTLTVVRAQEGSTARAIQVGDQVALAATAKVFTDIETAVTTVQAAFDPSTGHRHNGTDSRVVDHANLTNVSANQHHNRAHGAADHTDIGAAWQTWAPTIGALSGSFTTVSASGRYMLSGKTLFWNLSITITTNGTAGTAVTFTLPASLTAKARAAAVGRETGVTGKSLNCAITANASFYQVTNYDNTYPGQNGAILDVSGVLEVN